MKKVPEFKTEEEALAMRRFPLCALVLIVVLCSVVAVWGQTDREQLPGSMHGLAGLQKVKIIVADLDQEAVRGTGLMKEELVATLTAALLRSGAVKVETNQHKFVRASIGLNVFLMPSGDERYTVCTVILILMQIAFIPRDNEPWLCVPLAITWQKTHCLGIVPNQRLAQKVKQTTRDLVDKFTIDYFKENPQPAPPGAPPE